MSLDWYYNYHKSVVSDINEHMEDLFEFSRKCCKVVELGVRDVVSTWALLYGLSQNDTSQGSGKMYLGIDINSPPCEKLNLIHALCEKEKVNFKFVQSDDMKMMIPMCDMLFIDTLHTRIHLTYELEKFQSKVIRYIAMHDTSEPWGEKDSPLEGLDAEYSDNIKLLSGYISEGKYRDGKSGLWVAVEDFLSRHPEWKLVKRKTNNHGFTVLERVPSQSL